MWIRHVINEFSNSDASKVYDDDDDDDDHCHQYSSMELSSTNWPVCNPNCFMSRKLINKCWVPFFNHAALEFLNELDSDPGKIKLTSIHFPTSHIVDATIKDEQGEINFTR